MSEKRSRFFGRRQDKEQPPQTQQTQQQPQRQSAPRPTVAEAFTRMFQPQGKLQELIGIGNPGHKVIGKEQLRKAQQILQEYKEGKTNLEQRVIQNEEWYKMRHWDHMQQSKPNEVKPVSGWLFNSLQNKHADAMDNFPSPNILPREAGDKSEAQMLSSIVPVILDHCEFEQVYSDACDYKHKHGTGIYAVYWDKSAMNGLGDIAIKRADILSLYWQPGITDIQQSRNVFNVELMDNELIESIYPETKGKLSTATINVAKYIYDDTVDTSKKSAVVDWYYKKQDASGKKVLHYCKFVNDEVLFATENEEAFAERGLYDHGDYPFVFDKLFNSEGSPCGFGFIDVAKSAQEYIDRGNQAILRNMLANAKPRHFIRNDGSVNEQEYADTNNDFIHVDGNLGQDSIMPVQTNPLNNIYVEIINNKIDELKEVTGNRDISTGGTSSGVTAASAIAAMQEAGSKLSRDSNKATYRAFRKIVLMVIELIRQFYDVPRTFRIVGENGAPDYVLYTNAGIVPQGVEAGFGVDGGYRVPLFDVEISAQKQSPYSKMAQNELALQFYAAGFFAPQNADQALTCLDMMDFSRKEFIMQKIAQNGGLYQQLLMTQQQMMHIAQLYDQKAGTNLADQIAAGLMGATPPPLIEGSAPDAAGNVDKTEALGGEEGDGEASNTKKARQRVADSTDPT